MGFRFKKAINSCAQNSCVLSREKKLGVYTQTRTLLICTAAEILEFQSSPVFTPASSRKLTLRFPSPPESRKRRTNMGPYRSLHSPNVGVIINGQVIMVANRAKGV